MKLVECVPNFSTADPVIIEQIVASINHFDGAKVLHTDPDRDYNRTVITLIAEQTVVIDASFAAISKATELIDMRSHHGEHPRIGATDVYPLIPLGDSSFDECIRIAHQLANRVGTELAIPVYCYGMAAFSSDRRLLADIRRAQYEGLQEKLQSEVGKPDYGPAIFVAKTGAAVIGVRSFLIAYNINLKTEDINIARQIARKIRTSGYMDETGNRVPGKLSGIQAMGVSLSRPNRGRFTQVSTNVLDFFHSDSLHDVYEAVKTEAGTELVTGSEIVGLVPLVCLEKSMSFYNVTTVEEVIEQLGLHDLYIFDPDIKILDRHLDKWNT